MHHYFLSKSKIEELIDFKTELIGNINDDELKFIYDMACNWECRVVLFPYFFSHFLQKKINQKKDLGNEIEVFYGLQDTGFFFYQEFDRPFIESMFEYSRSRMEMGLEDIILTVQEEISQRKYESSLRY